MLLRFTFLFVKVTKSTISLAFCRLIQIVRDVHAKHNSLLNVRGKVRELSELYNVNLLPI